MRRGEFSIQALPAWCGFNDVSFFDVKVAEIEGSGLGLVAERDLVNEPDNVEIPSLLSIPKELVLSAEAVEEYAKEDKNFRDLLSVAGHESHRRDILLFLMMQMIISSPDYDGPKGGMSPWTQYFCLLPEQVPVPTMWSPPELTYLRGTSLEHAVNAKLSALAKEFEEIRIQCDDIPYWYDILSVDGLVTAQDWVLLDALYRSRSLELPKSGVAMVPCLDLVNHSRQASAYFEEDKRDEVTLLLRKGSSVTAGQEITIDYGEGKSAAEILFSYGFIEPGATARNMMLPLDSMDDDPLEKAKRLVFGAPPTLQIQDAENGIPKWSAPFVYLMCLNEEDGLQFAMLQETDGTRHLRLYWNDEDVTDKASEFENLISSHELAPVFRLRAVTVVLEQIQQQIKTIESHDDLGRILGLVRDEVVETALQLKETELGLLTRTLRILEDQVR
ncbi:hypothetical protein BX600DRAFT_239117 [Xylariales sp. PMI_506]|nr:hypothetical protein BX600DRAFT_239117 [Xylariales sp. PMI_506]